MSDSTHPNILGLRAAELESWCTDCGIPAYRARQLWSWIHGKKMLELDSMSDISRSLRQKIAHEFSFSLPPILFKSISSDGTIKYRFGKGDRYYEAVYIPAVAGSKTNTLCISSQAGCSLGCRFCYTASLGPGPDLNTAEIVGQLHAVSSDIGSPKTSSQGAVTNIVFMGMGEPLLNYDNVLRAIDIFNDRHGLGLSTRRITLSTAGIVPAIEKLGRASTVQLAVSLNAPTDELRTQLMPINRRYPLQQLMPTLHSYPLPRRRRISIEYVLLGGVNDSPAQARELVRLLAGIRVKVNLIPHNPHPASPFSAPASEAIDRFGSELRRRGIHAIERIPRGVDAGGACGLLGVDPQQRDTRSRCTDKTGL